MPIRYLDEPKVPKIKYLDDEITTEQTHVMPDGSVMAGATHTETVEKLPSLSRKDQYQALSQRFDQGEENLRQMIKNIPSSAGQYVKDIGSAVAHPIRTVKGLSAVVAGGLQKLIPDEQGQEEAFDRVVDVYKDKYGSEEQIRQEVIENPVGFLSDISAVMGLAGGAVKVAGKVARSPQIAKVGSQIVKAGQKVEPVTQAVGAVGKGLSKATDVKPFAKGVDSDVVASAQRVGVDLPASAISSNKGVALTESLVSKGFFGKPIVDKLANAEIKISQYADDIVAKTAGASDPSVAGKNIASAMDSYHNNYIAQKNALYKDANIGKDIIVSPTKTTAVVDAILNDKVQASKVLGSAEDMKYFTNIKNRLSGKGKKVDTGVLDAQGKPVMRTVQPEPLTGSELKSAINEINEKMKNVNDPIVTGNKAKMRKLVATMAEDLDDAIVTQKPELKESLTMANEFYKQGINKLNSSYGKAIQKFADAQQYDKIVPAIMKPTTSIDDVPRIMEIVGDAGRADIQANVLETFFKNSRGKAGGFSPYGLNRQMRKFGYDKLSQIFDENQIQALSDIDKLAQSLGKSKGVIGGSQTAFTGRMLVELGTLFANPALGARILLGDALASKLLSSPAGQQFLTTGVKTRGVVPTGKLIMKGAQTARGKEALVRQAGVIDQAVQEQN